MTLSESHGISNITLLTLSIHNPTQNSRRSICRRDAEATGVVGRNGARTNARDGTRRHAAAAATSRKNHAMSTQNFSGAQNLKASDRLAMLNLPLSSTIITVSIIVILVLQRMRLQSMLSVQSTNQPATPQEAYDGSRSCSGTATMGEVKHLRKWTGSI